MLDSLKHGVLPLSRTDHRYNQWRGKSQGLFRKTGKVLDPGPRHIPATDKSQISSNESKHTIVTKVGPGEDSPADERAH